MNKTCSNTAEASIAEGVIHARLVKAFEQRERAYLWVPADAIAFVPRVLAKVYGDGRALFALSTVNQRPAYWIIRACSKTDFHEFTDDVLTDLEEAFGNGRCGYSGNSLFHPKRERMRYCKCEDCAQRGVARWPMVDGSDGCSWGQLQWPKEFEVDESGHLIAAPPASVSHTSVTHLSRQRRETMKPSLANLA